MTATTPVERGSARRLPRGTTTGVVAAVYLLWTVITTWPLARHMGSAVPGDLGDPLLVSWTLWWDSHVLPLTERWWNAPMFHPVPGVLAFSEHFLGSTIITNPILWLTGNIQLAYNVAFVLTFVLCALAAYGLCLAIAGRHDAAFAAGLAFGFAPYRWFQVSHLHVLSLYWMPVILLALHLYFDDRRTRWLVLFGIAWVMQAFSCGYYLLYGSVLTGIWLLWFAVGRATVRDYVRVAGAWMIGIAIVSPVVYGYWFWQRAYGLRRVPREIEAFSADVASLLRASENLRFWGWLNVFERPESALFPGLMAPLIIATALLVGRRQHTAHASGGVAMARVLTAAALLFGAAAAVPLLFGPWHFEIGGRTLFSLGNAFKPFSVASLLLAAAAACHPTIRSAWRRRSPLVFYTAAAGVMWLFSLGPAPTIMGRPILYKAPYAWLMLLPGFEGVRVPARFWMLAALCLACAAGIALARLGSRWPRLRPALSALVCLGIAADGWPARFNVVAPPDARPRHSSAGARLELPLERGHDIIAVYRSAQHRQPLINGYSGYTAPHYPALQYALGRYDPEALVTLSELGPIEVVVDHDRDAAGEWRRFVAAYPHVQMVHDDGQYTSYFVEGRPQAPGPGEQTWLPVQSFAATANVSRAGRLIDGDLETRWDTGHPQRPGDSLTVDLGQPRDIRGVQFQMGNAINDFPRQLRIDTSLDGQAWSSAWSGSAAIVALRGAIQEPRVFPMQFSFEPHRARYLRFTQTGGDEIYYWSIAELRVAGK